jgi:hypothetical protein
LFRIVSLVPTQKADALEEFLLSHEAPGAIQRLESIITEHQGVTTAAVNRIRQALPSELRTWSSEIIDVATGTSKAKELGKWRPDMLFTRLGAEQGTLPEFAEYHAAPFSKQYGAVLEVGTGCGIDTLAIARSAEAVVTYEPHQVTAMVARGNFHRLNMENVRVMQAPWSPDVDMSPYGGLWADPSRRSMAGGRERSVERYHPPLSQLVHAITEAGIRQVGIKLGPGDDADVAIQLKRIEINAYKRECREKVVYSADAIHEGVSINIHFESANWHTFAPQRELDLMQHIPLTESLEPKAGMFLLEPHPALVAGGLVGWVFMRAQVTPIDPHIAYGLAISKPPATHLSDIYQILDVGPGVREKWIRQRVRELGWTQSVAIKKRGWGGDPEALRLQLDLKEAGPDDDSRAIIIARVGGGHITMLCSLVHRGSPSE